MKAYAQCGVLYDVSKSPYVLWPVLLGTALIVVGLLIGLFLRSIPAVRRWSLFALGILWTSIVVKTVILDRLTQERALRSASVESTEGVITAYYALGARDHGREYFDVAGRRFDFSEFDLGPGFKLTRRRGGPLDVGSYVRIASCKGTILRIELCSR